MKRMMLRVAGLVVLFGALSVATAHADTRFSIHVGIGAPPVVVAPGPYGYDGYYSQAPYPGYVWQPGYYVGYRWVPGGGFRAGGTSSGTGINTISAGTTRSPRLGAASRSNWSVTATTPSPPLVADYRRSHRGTEGTEISSYRRDPLCLLCVSVASYVLTTGGAA